MKKLFLRLNDPFVTHKVFNIGMLFFRIAVCLEMILVHGLKKLGISATEAEKIPNPLHLPEFFNDGFAMSANILFPFLVLIGLYTRLATIPTLAVTLTGYFVLHWNDAALVRDTPFMYSAAFLLILLLGPGKYSVDNYISKND
ncbi:MAG: DoxX family protein [Ferruginibacter sp.]|nr:DoxX family protein [Ferruginibacter sp.]